MNRSLIEVNVEYIKFAELKLPIPASAKAMLFEIYGDQVMIIPKAPKNRSHNIFFDKTRPYSEYITNKSKYKLLKNILKNIYKKNESK